jgi:outer membrane protein OmpA-like peptidoglycan-associated protein
MKLQYITFSLTFCLLFSLGFSQDSKVKKALKEYDNFAYVKTTEILQEVVDNGYSTVPILQKLANSYYFNHDMEKAVTAYKALFELDENQDTEYHFRYAVALRSIGNDAEADRWMQKFHELQPNDLRGKAFTSKVDYKTSIEKLSRDHISPINLDFNTAYSDFGVAEFNNRIIFASARGGGNTYKWNEEPFLDLYAAEKVKENTYNYVVPLEHGINTDFHESSVAYSPDGKHMFFTRNNFYYGEAKRKAKQVNRLELFRISRNDQGEWGKISSVHFNSDAYSVAHPTISSDGKRLYFASDMPGTLGASDIFVVEINADGTLGTPRNLGDRINTEAQETFPYVNAVGDLYFATNGLPGLGGLDVFVSKGYDAETTTGVKASEVYNIGKPVNSRADDFAYYENLVTGQVFFSSNRLGGRGSDDIYTFKDNVCEQIVEVKVREAVNKTLIEGATLIVFDKGGKELERQIVNQTGSYSFKLPCNTEYLVRGSKTGYIPDEKRFVTPSSPQDLEIDLYLEQDQKIIAPCDDLAKILNIPIIYFDYDKYAIRYDAEVELQKVLAVLKQYPTMTIAIRSHTDCRGTYAYNERLSENRAQATRNYLISKGIEAQRITAKGYGESRLVNNCGCEPTNTSSCSEAEHQQNRRSEFIVTSIKGKTCNE